MTAGSCQAMPTKLELIALPLVKRHNVEEPMKRSLLLFVLDCWRRRLHRLRTRLPSRVLITMPSTLPVKTIRMLPWPVATVSPRDKPSRRSRRPALATSPN